MKTIRTKSSVLVLPQIACLALAASSMSHAAVITMVNTNTIGQSWNTVTAWSNNAAATSGNDYVVGKQNDGKVFTVRPPNTTGPHTFPGDSLTLQGGQFNLLVPGTDGVQRRTTVGDLRVSQGGVILNATGGDQFLGGNLNFISGAAANVIRTAGSSAGGARNIMIESTISGGGTVRVLQRGTVTLNNSGNSFGGTWHLGGANVLINSDANANATAGTPVGISSISNTSGERTTFVANSGGLSTGSLGLNSNVIVDLYSLFTLGYDWNTTGSLSFMTNTTANTDAVRMTLDRNVTVGALTIAGDSLDAGVYDYSQLSTAGYANYFTNNAGTITVIPEPSALLATALGSLLMLARRRRC